MKKLQFNVEKANIDLATQVLSCRKDILHEPCHKGIMVICPEALTMQVIMEMYGLMDLENITITLASVFDV